MTTITETRSLGNQTADMEQIGGIAAAQSTTDKRPSHFQQALAVWIERRDELNNAPLEEDQAKEDARADLLFAAENKVVSEEARTPGEVRALAEVIFQDSGSVPPPRLLSALFAALSRLDGNKPSPTFNAKHWLFMFELSGGGWVERNGEIMLMHPTTPNDRIEDLLWELETRDGLEAVKAEIRSRSEQRDTPDAWTSLLATYVAAETARDLHEKVWGGHAFGTRENIEHEALTEKLTNEHTAALEALFAHPSPTKEAFATKVRLFHAEQLYDWTDAATFSRIIAEEAARFTS